MRRENRKNWRFFWKNVNGLGRLLRFVAAAGFFATAAQIKDDDQLMAGLLAGWGCAFLFDGMMKWSPYRALFKWPTKRAFLKHFPGIEEEA